MDTLTRPKKPAMPCNGGCGKMLRPSKTMLSDYPNTVLNCGFGYCRPCKGLREPHNRGPRPTHCVKCTLPLRRWNQSAVDFPDTVRESNFGVCVRCYRKELDERKRAEGLLDDEVVGPDFDVDQARADLEIWLDERRRRIDARKHYPVAGLTVQYNPYNEVAVVIRNGNPLGATYGLSNGFKLANSISTTV